MMTWRTRVMVLGLVVSAAFGSGVCAQVQTAPATALITAMKDAGAAIHDLDARITITTYTDGAEALSQEVRLYLRQPDAMRLDYLAPAYLAGNATLIIGSDMDVYIAAADRWYEKDLSTLDSAEQPWLLMRNVLTDVHDLLSDYRFTLVQETRGGKPVAHLDGVPVSNGATYGRIELWVDPQTLVPLERRLYDIDGNLLADARFSEITQIAPGVFLPLVIEAYDAAGALRNRITYRSPAVNQGLASSLFIAPDGASAGGGGE